MSQSVDPMTIDISAGRGRPPMMKSDKEAKNVRMINRSENANRNVFSDRCNHLSIAAAAHRKAEHELTSSKENKTHN